jgi:translation initiation factor IF-2
MGKVRVYEIAREMGLDNKELVTKIKSMGIVVNNHMSALEADDVVRIRRQLEREKQQTHTEDTWLDEGVFVRKASKKPAPAPQAAVPPLAPPTPREAASPAEKPEPRREDPRRSQPEETRVESEDPAVASALARAEAERRFAQLRREPEKPKPAPQPVAVEVKQPEPPAVVEPKPVPREEPKPAPLPQPEPQAAAPMPQPPALPRLSPVSRPAPKEPVKAQEEPKAATKEPAREEPPAAPAPRREEPKPMGPVISLSEPAPAPRREPQRPTPPPTPAETKPEPRRAQPDENRPARTPNNNQRRDESRRGQQAHSDEPRRAQPQPEEARRTQPQAEETKAQPSGPVVTLSAPVAPAPRREPIAKPQPEPQASAKPAQGDAPNVISLGPVVTLPPVTPLPRRTVTPPPMTTPPGIVDAGRAAREGRLPPNLTNEENRNSNNKGGNKGKENRGGNNNNNKQQDNRNARPASPEQNRAPQPQPQQAQQRPHQHQNQNNNRQNQNNNRRGPQPAQKAPAQAPAAPMSQAKKVVRITDTIVVAELAKAMGVKAVDVLKKLISQGIMATINQNLDYETSALIAQEFGWDVVNTAVDFDAMIGSEDEKVEDRISRPPVVTIMGHVDHGKTTLLDALRQANVAAGEAGGITQHIGAYQVRTNRGVVVFLDTPGHEAFTKMRARGAEVTDVVVLVVAADDGVKPQTIEAIQHAKAAGVPIVVAINKIDKPGSDPSRVKTALMEFNIIGEEFGGDVMMVPVSAKQRLNLEQLLDAILLQSEVLELKANPKRRAVGVVIESKLDRGRGAVATVLVQEGTISVGDAIASGPQYGRVRALYDDRGRAVESAGPAMPVEVIGFSGVPNAGDQFFVAEDEATAKKYAEAQQRSARAIQAAEDLKRRSNIAIPMPGDEAIKTYAVIIKGDVQGSVEAVKKSIEQLATEKVKVDVVLAGVGGITESDVNLASTAKAAIIGFNVRTAGKAAQLAEQMGVDIRFYNIIYEAVEETKKAMTGLLEPKLVQKTIGRAEVRNLFQIPKVGTVAGCMVTEGKIHRGAMLRLLRDSVQIYQGRFASLRRFKDDVREVSQGFECGLGIENYNDLKLGDIIEAFEEEKVAAVL